MARRASTNWRESLLVAADAAEEQGEENVATALRTAAEIKNLGSLTSIAHAAAGGDLGDTTKVLHALYEHASVFSDGQMDGLLTLVVTEWWRRRMDLGHFLGAFHGLLAYHYEDYCEMVARECVDRAREEGVSYRRFQQAVEREVGDAAREVMVFPGVNDALLRCLVSDSADEAAEDESRGTVDDLLAGIAARALELDIDAQLRADIMPDQEEYEEGGEDEDEDEDEDDDTEEEEEEDDDEL